MKKRTTIPNIMELREGNNERDTHSTGKTKKELNVKREKMSLPEFVAAIKATTKLNVKFTQRGFVTGFREVVYIQVHYNPIEGMYKVFMAAGEHYIEWNHNIIFTNQIRTIYSGWRG